eukprot:scaffold207809_cov32-Tisochrysis_lutea.AAC.8
MLVNGEISLLLRLALVIRISCLLMPAACGGLPRCALRGGQRAARGGSRTRLPGPGRCPLQVTLRGRNE